MVDIPWERTADGMSAEMKEGESPRRAIFPVLSLLLAAEQKMRELVLIAADFHGVTVIFERQLGIYLEKDAHAEYLGIYQTDEGDDADVPEERARNIPTLCIRRARWDRKRDIQRFRQSQSKQAYVKRDGQIDATILFLTPEMYPEITSLPEEAMKFVRQGISLNANERTDPRWDTVLFQVTVGSIAFSLSYSPNREENEVLETWMETCQQRFTKVDFSGGIISDHGCRISYPYSLMERLETFPE